MNEGALGGRAIRAQNEETYPKPAKSCTARQAIPASPIGACHATLSAATSERIAPLVRAMQANAVEEGGVEARF